jgi:hypothetical protein
VLQGNRLQQQNSVQSHPMQIITVEKCLPFYCGFLDQAFVLVGGILRPVSCILRWVSGDDFHIHFWGKVLPNGNTYFWGIILCG